MAIKQITLTLSVKPRDTDAKIKTRLGAMIDEIKRKAAESYKSPAFGPFIVELDGFARDSEGTSDIATVGLALGTYSEHQMAHLVAVISTLNAGGSDE